MQKPDRFLLVSAPNVDEKLAELGGAYKDRYIVTSAMSWDTERDEPCLLMSVFVDSEGKEEQAYAQVFYLSDVQWVPLEQVAQLNREAVLRDLVQESTQEELNDV